MLNSVSITGRLTHQPTLQTKKNGDYDLRFLRFVIACQRNFKNPDGTYSTDFVDCVAWKTTAEFIEKNFVRGQEITIEGELRTDNYTDKNGTARKSTVINVEHAFFSGLKKTKEVSDTSQNISSEDVLISDDEYAPPLDTYIEESFESEPKK